MTSIEFIIIYMLAGLFFGLFILYRAIDGATDISIRTSQAVMEISTRTAEVIVKLSALIHKMGNDLESQNKASLEIVKALEKMAAELDSEFASIKNELASLRHKTDASPPPPPDK